MEEGYIDRWAIVYQTGINGSLDAAILIGYESMTKQIIKSFDIPLNEMSGVGLSSIDSQPKAVKIAKPKPQLKSVVSRKKISEDEKHSE